MTRFTNKLISFEQFSLRSDDVKSYRVGRNSMVALAAVCVCGRNRERRNNISRL